LKYEQFSEASFPLRKTTTLGMGYAFEINEKLVLKPNFLLKVSDSFNGNLDAGISALLYEKAWVGISFRQNSSVNLLLNFNITDFMRIGYSYDYQYNQLNIVSKGAHELFLGFDFSLNKVKVLSPRYL
jgi:type IX secretion system PorP/SprF family membrane protein